MRFRGRAGPPGAQPLPRVLSRCLGCSSSPPPESPIPPSLALQAASGLPDLAEASSALAAAVAEDTPRSWEAASMLGELAAADSEA